MLRSMDGGWVFALPPSLGPAAVASLQLQFEQHLPGSPFAAVIPIGSYEELEQSLLTGKCHAAWCPPIVCARIESSGGTVALRSVRYGSTTYRSVLLCRANDPLDLRELAEAGDRRLSAAWVDKWSMGGYILPRYHLRTRGLELAKVFKEELLLESYGACFDAVLAGRADLCASFAGRRGLGYVDLCGDRAVELRALSYTDESPNDGIVISPALLPRNAESLVQGLHRLIADERSHELLSSTFDVNGFDEPRPGTYSALLSLLL
jgi:phosphonate transport system substrate-binding protein